MMRLQAEAKASSAGQIAPDAGEINADRRRPASSSTSSQCIKFRPMVAMSSAPTDRFASAFLGQGYRHGCRRDFANLGKRSNADQTDIRAAEPASPVAGEGLVALRGRHVDRACRARGYGNDQLQ
jgi:hypothetical protein